MLPLPSACLLVSCALASGGLHVTRVDANGDVMGDPKSFRPSDMRNFRLKVRREFLKEPCDIEKGVVPDPYLGVKLFHAGHDCPEPTKAISDADGLPRPGSRIRALFIHCPTGYCSYCEGDCVKLNDPEAKHFCVACAEEFRPGEGVKFPCQRTGHKGHREKLRRCEKCGFHHDPHLPCDAERDMEKLRMREKQRETRRREQKGEEGKDAERQKMLENLTPEQARYLAEVAECANVMIEEHYNSNGATDIAGLSGGYKDPESASVSLSGPEASGYKHDWAALDLDSVTSVCS